MTDVELTEYLYKRGCLPKWAYYQLNGKSAAENYRDQHFRNLEVERELEAYREKRKAEIDAEIESEIENELAPKIEAALNDLLKDWQ